MIGYAVRIDGTMWRTVDCEFPDPEHPEWLSPDYDVEYWWPYSDGQPPDPVKLPPTQEEILASQSAILSALNQECNAQKSALTQRISTIQDAIDAKDDPDAEEFWATPEEEAELPVRKTQLTKWKQYGILLGRVTSQAGWPPDAVWPTKPAGGMDLSVSSTSPDVA